MYLEDLIKMLESYDPDITVREGFSYPHSYRGYYSELAFEPTANVTIGSMLEAAREALGSTYTGYKGGEFTMNAYTEVYLAPWGHTGEELSARLLRYMLADEVR